MDLIRPLRKFWLPLGLLCIISGCNSEHPGSAPAKQRELRPILTIHSDEASDHSFGIIGNILIGRDGELYIQQPRDERILLYAADGTFERSIGKDGEGPGEFRALYHIGWVGDTLWATDPILHRISFFTPHGDLISTAHFDPEIPRWPRRALPVALLADGSILATGDWSITSLVHDTLNMLPVVRFSRAGRFLGTIAQLSLKHEAFQAATGGGMIQGVQPFSDSPILAAAADGSRFAIVHRDATGNKPTIRISSFSAAGDTLFDHSYPITPHRVSAATVDSVLAQLGPPFDTIDRSILYRPDWVPPVSDVEAGRDGTVWLRREAPPDGGDVRWDVTAPDGAPAGSVTLPAKLRIVEAERNRIWTVQPDSNDVPVVAVYQVNPR